MIAMPLDDWRRAVLALGIQELPLSGTAAIRGAQAMPGHDDPFDRLLVGAALTADATLLTADSRLLAWKGPLPRHNARS